MSRVENNIIKRNIADRIEELNITLNDRSVYVNAENLSLYGQQLISKKAQLERNVAINMYLYEYLCKEDTGENLDE